MNCCKLLLTYLLYVNSGKHCSLYYSKDVYRKEQILWLADVLRKMALSNLCKSNLILLVTKAGPIITLWLANVM